MSIELHRLRLQPVLAKYPTETVYFWSAQSKKTVSDCLIKVVIKKMFRILKQDHKKISLHFARCAYLPT